MQTHMYILFLVFAYLGYAYCFRCYKTDFDTREIIIISGCKTCGIVVNICGSFHRCSKRRHGDSLVFKYGILFYACNRDLCNYVIPLPTPASKLNVENEEVSSMGQSEKQTINH